MSQTAETEASRRFTQILVPLGAILFVTGLLIVCNGGIRVGYSNHTGLMPVVRRLLDENYLPDNFGITLRLYHHRSFVYLVAGFAKLFGEDNALIILSILGNLFLSASLYALSRCLKLSVLAYLAWGFLIAMSIGWTGFGLETNTFLGSRETQPPTFAHAALLYSVAFYLRDRFRLAAFFAGLVVVFHLQIGFALALILLPFFALRLKTLGWREALLLVGFFLLPASLALIDVPHMLNRGLVKEPFTLTDINFRQAWHFELKEAQAVYWFLAHLALQVIVFLWLRRSKKTEARSMGVLVALSLLITALSILHLTDYYVLKIATLAKFQFLRMSLIVTVFGALSVIVWINKYTGEKSNRAVIVANLSLIGFATILYAIPATRQGAPYAFTIERYTARNNNWVKTCLWVKQNTPAGATFLTPPENDGFVYLSDRSNVVDFKINPDGGQYLAEWYERLRDLAGGTLPDKRGQENVPYLSKGYAGLSDQQLLALAAKYRASYAVLSKATTASFPVLYENEGFKVVVFPMKEN
jgi:hypothetical protein